MLWRYPAHMPKLAMIVVGVVVLSAVTFASPFEGNVLGFCPISEGPKAVGVDARLIFPDIQ